MAGTDLFNDLEAMQKGIQPLTDNEPVAHDLLHRCIMPLMRELRAWRVLWLQTNASYSEGQATALLDIDRLQWRTVAHMLRSHVAAWGDDQWTRFREQYPPAGLAPSRIAQGERLLRMVEQGHEFTYGDMVFRPGPAGPQYTGVDPSTQPDRTVQRFPHASK